MESIREIFKDKGFSDEALSYLENAINEFEEVFGDYVSREDLIERVKRNVDIIEFSEKLDSTTTCAMGCYSCADKKIQIMNGLDEETIKSVFFHEFLHAIVAEGKNTGFRRVYEIVDFDDEKGVNIGKGWNEGVVQMMTQERDKKIANKVLLEGAYPILTELVTKFANLFGRNELIDLYFNHADQFMDFMIEKSEIFGTEFLEDFDVIHKYEKEIFQKKVALQDSMSKLMLFFIENQAKRDINNQTLKSAQERIMQVYLDMLLQERIESTTELQDTFKNISEMYNVFSKTISVQTIQRLIEQSNSNVLSNLDGLDWETQLLLDSGIEFENFKKLEVSEKIKILMDEEFVDSFWGNLGEEYPLLMEEYFSSIVTELYDGCGDFQNKDLSSWLLDFRGVARYIGENNLSFENLRITYNKYRYSGAVFELYNLQENGEYEKVSTLVVDGNSENYDAKECTEVEIERLTELRERISKEYSIEIVEAVEDENGNYIVYDDNGQVFVSTEFNETERSHETMNFESVNELKLKIVEQKIANRTTRLKGFQEMQVPDIIIQQESDKLEEVMSEKNRVIEKIRGATRKKIIPSQIEARTINGNVTLQTMQTTLAELATQDKVIENEGEDLNVE